MTAKYTINYSILGLILLSCLLSCNIYKQIPEGKSVLVRNNVNVLGQEKDLINDFFYKEDLYKIPAQKENKKIWFFPLSQHIWAFYNQRKLNDHTQFMKTRIGNPPILFDSSKIEKSRKAFENYYFNIGHLDAKVDVEYLTKNKRTTVNYNVTPNSPYRIRNIYWDTLTEVQKEIYKDREESHLLEKDIFNINNFINEIERLTLVANSKGYYTFNKEFIKFNFDTFKETHELDVFVKILEESDTSKFKKYTIDSIFVLVNSSNEIKKLNKLEVNNIKGIQFIQSNPKDYNERFLSRFIHRSSDSFYSKADINYSIQRLTELNNFKLINTSVKVKNTEQRKVDLLYSLTPFHKNRISLGQNFYNSTLGFIGAQPTISFLNRNLTSKSDKLNISLSGAMEFNLYLNNNRNYTGLISRTDITLNSNYNIEKFILPFLVFKNENKYIFNRTQLSGQYSYSKRLGYYDIHNLGVSAGYEWTHKKNQAFNYNPLAINFILIPENSISSQFDSTLNQNPYLRSSFTNTIIFGSNFQFNVFKNFGKRRNNNYNFKFNAETAGNFSYLFDKFLIPLNRDSTTNLNINGIDVSQYFKAQMEIGMSNQINRGSSFHTRIKGGIAVPYGNSNKLPYIKQFFIGGPYSIRSFQPRTIGPGTYNPGQFDTDNSKYPRDQLGNMLLEINAEYRFNIISSFKGALFVDAGNIWNTSREFSQSDLSVFQPDQFLKQLYIGGGFGLRYSITYVTLRLDIGIPIRVPYDKKNQWEILDAKPFNGDWISNNVLTNFAVGYPF